MSWRLPVCEQQDAAEYFEKILRKTSGNAATVHLPVPNTVYKA